MPGLNNAGFLTFIFRLCDIDNCIPKTKIEVVKQNN